MSGFNPEFPDFVTTEADTSFPLSPYVENMQRLPEQLQFDVLDFMTELAARNTANISPEPADPDQILVQGFNKTIVTPERLWLESLRQAGAPISFNPNFAGSSQTVVSHPPEHTAWLERITMQYDCVRFPAAESAKLSILDVIAQQGDHLNAAYSPHLGRTALGALYPEQSDRTELQQRVFMSGLVAKAAMTSGIMQVTNIEDDVIQKYARLRDEGVKPFTIAEQQAFIDPTTARILHQQPPQ